MGWAAFLGLAEMVYHPIAGKRQHVARQELAGREAVVRAGLWGLAAGLGTFVWLAALGVILWRLPLGVVGDYAVFLIEVCTLPISLLVGASVFSHADPRGRGPTDAPYSRRRPHYMRRPPHDMF